MFREVIESFKGSCLRKNNFKKLKIGINPTYYNKVFIINQENFYTENITEEKLIIKPSNYYMLINNSEEPIEALFNQDISTHSIIYNPYYYEAAKKRIINPKKFIKRHNVRKGYVDILAKWYSIKFSYADHNVIYLKPRMGISIQKHKHRVEKWEIISGNPIIINKNRVYYHVKQGTLFSNPKLAFHSIINPNDIEDDFVVIKETWEGDFYEDDILRVFNPNNYY